MARRGGGLLALAIALALALALAIVPLLAFAGDFEQTITGMSVAEWGGIFGASLLSGFVMLLLRLYASQTARLLRNEGLKHDDAAIIRGSLLLYTLSHLSGSVLSGCLTYFTVHDVITSGHAIAAALMAAGAGGAKTVEIFAEKNRKYVETMRMQ